MKPYIAVAAADCTFAIPKNSVDPLKTICTQNTADLLAKISVVTPVNVRRLLTMCSTLNSLFYHCPHRGDPRPWAHTNNGDIRLGG